MKADIESPPGDPMIRVGGIAASWGVCCGPRRYLVYIPSGISLQFRAPVRIRWGGIIGPKGLFAENRIIRFSHCFLSSELGLIPAAISYR